MLIIGTLFHALIGFGLGYFFSPFAVALMFAFKELGEQKYKIQGSIKTLEKNVKMIAAVFKPLIAIQWIAAGAGAAIWLAF